jgi:outer membrane immunogenic protein
MHCKRIRGLACALLAGTLVTSVAYGADLPLKAPILAPAIAPPVTWTGFSIFGLLGWGQIGGSTDYTGTDSFSQAFLNSANQAGFPLSYNSNTSGFVGGGGGEYDYQIGFLVLGARADYTYFGQNSTSSVTVALGKGANAPSVTVTNKIGLVGIATARGVIGYAPPALPNLLIYANAGPAFAQTSQELIVNTTPNFFGIDQPFDANTWGWTVGGGARYLFDTHWYAQVEANYFDLTNWSTDNTILGNLNYRRTVGLTATDVTGGIGYKF